MFVLACVFCAVVRDWEVYCTADRLLALMVTAPVLPFTLCTGAPEAVMNPESLVRSLVALGMVTESASAPTSEAESVILDDSALPLMVLLVGTLDVSDG